MSGTHHEAGGHRSCGVPVVVSKEVPFQHEKQRLGSTYEFDRHLLVIEEIGALKNDTERSLTDLLADSVVDSHHV